MKKAGIFYGSTTGTTAEVAEKLASLLGIDAANVHDVAKSSPSMLGDYETLLLGSSTWGSGEVQDDWYDFLDGAAVLSLKGHRIALFGCGDETMSDTFCGALGVIYHRLKPTGAEFIGEFDAAGYDFTDSEARRPDGLMVGLVLDQVNHPDLTDDRLRRWTASLAL